jgi:hypothetical protein
LLAHVPESRPAAEKCAGEIDVQRLLPLLDPEIQERSPRKHRGTTNEIVDSPIAASNSLKRFVYVILLADVDFNEGDRTHICN